MREIHGCELFYLVEGNFVFDGESAFNGVKYSTINNDIIKLQLVHNIKIIRTGCIKHTAVEILEMCKFLALNKIPKHRSVDKLIGILKTITEKYSEGNTIKHVACENIDNSASHTIALKEDNTTFHSDKVYTPKEDADTSKDIGSDESEITEDTNITADKVESDNNIFSVWKSLINTDDEKLIRLSKIFRLCDWINGPKCDFKYDPVVMDIISSDRNMGKLLSPITRTDSVKIHFFDRRSTP